jgi:hypothetical protein
LLTIKVLKLSLKLYLRITRTYLTTKPCIPIPEDNGTNGISCEKNSFTEPTCVEILYDVTEERLSFQFHVEPIGNGHDLSDYDVDWVRIVDSDQDITSSPEEENGGKCQRNSIYSHANLTCGNYRKV